MPWFASTNAPDISYYSTDPSHINSFMGSILLTFPPQERCSSSEFAIEPMSHPSRYSSTLEGNPISRSWSHDLAQPGVDAMTKRKFIVYANVIQPCLNVCHYSLVNLLLTGVRLLIA